MSTRVLIIADLARHREERTALLRFAVGLAAEGLRSALLLGVEGEDALRREPTLGPVPVIEVPVEVPWWIRERTAEAVLAPLEGTTLDQPDLVLALGRGALPVARSIAAEVDATLLAEIREKREIAALDGDVALAVCATPALARLATRRLGGDRAVELPIPAPRPNPLIKRDPGLLVVLGPVGDLATWSAMVDGLAGPGGPVAGLQQVAMELGDRSRDMVLWKRLRQSSLADRITSFDRPDRLRDPLSTADVVVLPDPGGPVRSLERQAAGRGGVVVAVADPIRDDLQPDRDARIITRGAARRPGVWRETVEAAFREAPSVAAIKAGEDSLVSRVAPRWAALVDTLIRGDATPIAAGHED